MGYSVRTKDYRYTEWQDVKTGGITATELYDHTNDPGETKNRAYDAQYSHVLIELRSVLKRGWESTLPRGSLSPTTID